MQNKVKLSHIIQGCMTWGKWGANFSTKQYQHQIQACLSEGITTFDHADIYGGYTTEAEFGLALREMRLNREDIQLISKCGIQMEHFRTNKVKHYQYDSAYIIHSVEQALNHLQTEYIDLYMLHRPSPLMKAEEIQKAIDLLLKQGKIRCFGVSNFSIQQMELLQTKVSIEVNQIEISLTHSASLENGALDYMQKHQIQALAWSPLGEYFKKTSPTLCKTAQDLCQKYAATEGQILLAWLHQHPINIKPVIGTTKIDRLKLAASAYQLKLELEDWFLLWEAARDKQVD